MCDIMYIQVLENTQEKAVKSHFVSDPNNLYVGKIVHGLLFIDILVL